MKGTDKFLWADLFLTETQLSDTLSVQQNRELEDRQGKQQEPATEWWGGESVRTFVEVLSHWLNAAWLSFRRK